MISDLVDQLDPSLGPVCDLFAGSGTVSDALSKNRTVFSIDIQEYSRTLSSALLKPAAVKTETIEAFWQRALYSGYSSELSWATAPLVDYEEQCIFTARSGDSEPLCDFLEYACVMVADRSGSDKASPALRSALVETISRLRKRGLWAAGLALVTRYFGGTYFSFSQAVQFDSLLETIDSFISSHERDTFMAPLLSTASEIVNTIGKQFAQPLRPRRSDGKPKPNLIDSVTRDRSSDVFQKYEKWLRLYVTRSKSTKGHRIICDDFLAGLDAVGPDAKVVYADPPYTRDHYSRFYHVLETLCFRDEPEVSTVRINGQDRLSRGVYRASRHQSPFCIKSKAPEAFAAMFQKVRELDLPLLLSYSPFEKATRARPRVLGIEDIVREAKKFFENVEVQKAGRFSHNKLNNTQNNVSVSYDAEVLITCRP